MTLSRTALPRTTEGQVNRWDLQEFPLYRPTTDMRLSRWKPVHWVAQHDGDYGPPWYEPVVRLPPKQATCSSHLQPLLTGI